MQNTTNKKQWSYIMQKKEKQQFDKLYSLHLENLRLQGKSKKTIASYGKSIRRLVEFFNSSPENLTKLDLKKYFSSLVSSHSWSTVIVDLNGIKFFWKYVLDKEWEWVDIVKPPVFKSLPDVLSLSETVNLLNTFKISQYKVFFFTVYSMGLRINEALTLEVRDIDSSRMFVHIRCSKRNKDRFVPLPKQTLVMLRSYWKTHKNSKLIFPHIKGCPSCINQTTKHMNQSAAQSAIKAAVKDAGIKKKITTHSLRHTYATHLLEFGLSLRHIQEILGHSSPVSTAVYTKLTQVSEKESGKVICKIMTKVYSGLNA